MEARFSKATVTVLFISAIIICSIEGATATPEHRVTCPSPIKEGTHLDKPMNCGFFFSNWYVVNYHANDIKPSTNVAYCRRAHTSCINRVTGYQGIKHDPDSTADYSNTSLSYTLPMTRQREGTWNCSITDSFKIVAWMSCFLQVYEPPTPLECTIDLSPEHLRVDCITEKVYPEATCLWYYKNQTNSTTHLIPSEDSTSSISILNEKYFKTNCSLVLTSSEDPKIEAGNFSVHVLAYPSVKAADNSFINNVGIKAESYVVIELPEDPVFKFDNSTKTGLSLVYREDEEIVLTCQVNQGKPAVENTTMSCDFPVSQSGERTLETFGNTFRLSTKATPNMNGSSCFCVGNHITGVTKKAFLTIQVLYSARIKNFTFNSTNEKLTIVNLTDTVSLECRGAGNPSPLVTIFRLKSNSTEQEKVAEEMEETVKDIFQAKCEHNGKYQCRVQNTMEDVNYNETDDLDLRVRCPPTSCAGREKVEVDFTPGNIATMSLCVRAYPAPGIDTFVLQKADGQMWTNYTGPNVSIATDVHSDILEGVTVIFYNTLASDTGKYRLVFNTSEHSLIVSEVDFQNAAAKGQSDSFPVVAVVVPLIIIIIIIIIIIVVVVILRRRGSSRKNIGGSQVRRDGEEGRKSNNASSYAMVIPRNKRNNNTEQDNAATLGGEKTETASETEWNKEGENMKEHLYENNPKRGANCHPFDENTDSTATTTAASAHDTVEPASEKSHADTVTDNCLTYADVIITQTSKKPQTGTSTADYKEEDESKASAKPSIPVSASNEKGGENYADINFEATANYPKTSDATSPDGTNVYSN